MNLQINNEPIEYYFDNNIITYSIGKLIKYYIGIILFTSANFGMIVQ